jgi:hypothetical protein
LGDSLLGSPTADQKATGPEAAAHGSSFMSTGGTAGMHALQEPVSNRVRSILSARDARRQRQKQRPKSDSMIRRNFERPALSSNAGRNPENAVESDGASGVVPVRGDRAASAQIEGRTASPSGKSKLSRKPERGRVAERLRQRLNQSADTVRAVHHPVLAARSRVKAALREKEAAKAVASR